MHWPQGNDPETGKTIPFGQSPTFVETWKEMEKLLDTGKVRSIGCVGKATFARVSVQPGLIFFGGRIDLLPPLGEILCRHQLYQTRGTE